ncbi:MAG: hypothetical protein MJ153_00115 [Clostridia bacterium]|nr:hypothetical protein [Clostridia bacterium]
MRKKMQMLKRITTLLLLVTLMLSSFASCGFFGRKADNQNEYISKPELVRLVVNSINTKSDSDMYSFYSSIPDKQKKDVSYSDFAQYVEALRRLTQLSGAVTGYRFLIGEEKTDAFQQLISDAGITTDQFKTYGNLEVVDFLFDSEEENTYKTVCRMFIGIDEHGYAFLPSEWIKQTNRLFTYIKLYFNEIDEQNVDALMSAMSYSNSNSNVVRARALALIDFYRMRVRGDSSSYILREISPFYSEIVIPEVRSDDKLRSRKVKFTQYNGVIENNDIIPIEVEDKQFNLYSRKTGLKLLAIGNNYSKGNVESLLGKCLFSSYNKDDIIEVRTNSNGESEEVYKIICNYNGMMLIFEGIITDEASLSWEGVLTGIKMYGACDYVLGEKVTYGVSKATMLIEYPFFEEYNCILKNSDYELSFEFDAYDNASTVYAHIK